MDMVFDKITRKAFEEKLANEFGRIGMTKDSHVENSYDHNKSKPVVSRMTLYYYKDVHVATWQNRRAWIMSFAFNKAKLKELVNMKFNR